MNVRAAQAGPASAAPPTGSLGAPHGQHAILAAGQRLPQSMLRPPQWGSPEVQRILFAARRRFGHALCTCGPQPLKLQIRLRDDKCHLAVWPGEHAAHDSGCLFFRQPLAPTDPSGRQRAPALPPALSRPAPRSATARRSHVPSRAALWLGACAPPEAAPVSVMSLAQRLWEAAELCRWHPGWMRDWARTRYQLLRSARGFTLNDCPLEHLLFVPRAYRFSTAATLHQEWTAFVRSLRGSGTLAPSLLVSPVRAWRAPQGGQAAVLWLRHLPTDITLQPACWDFLARACRGALAGSRLAPRQRQSPDSVSASPDRRPDLVAFVLVEGLAPHGPCARAAWLLPVHPDCWIPAADAAAVRRIDALLAAGCAFHCGFGAAAPSAGCARSQLEGPVTAATGSAA